MKNARILLTLALVVSALVACDSYPNKPNTRNNFTYQVTGVAVADYDQDRSQVAVSVLRDSTLLRTATVRLENDTLDLAKPTFA